MLLVPITEVPAQQLNIQLAGQSCTIKLYQKSTGLFLDLLMNSQLVIGGVICHNLNRIVRNNYFGFAGDLMFEDMQGSADPYFGAGGLGSRFLLCFLEESDLWGVQ